MKTNTKNAILKTIATTSLALAPIWAQAQLKINSLNQVTDQAKEGADAIKTVATYVVAAVLGIGLIFVVYALATSNPKAKEYVIGWVIAVIVVLIAGMII